MAKHIARGWGQPWSGTPEDLVLLSHEGQQIVRSAAGDGHECAITVKMSGRRESSYASPEEFLADFRPSDIPYVESVMIYYADTPTSKVAVTVDLVRGMASRPFVTVFGDEPSLADGLANRLAHLFPGRRLSWQGLRRQGEISKLERLRARAGTTLALAVTVAITVAVTIYVTRLLT